MFAIAVLGVRCVFTTSEANQIFFYPDPSNGGGGGAGSSSSSLLLSLGIPAVGTSHEAQGLSSPTGRPG
jgi:hypothetical protein